MKITKIVQKIMMLFITLLIATTINAQQFDWATSFTGGNAENKVSFSATDSQGNLYIAGQCGTGAAINGTVLLNMAPYGSGCNHSNFFIAKLSPNGQVIWRKAIHNNNGGLTGCNYMKLIGDSSIVFSVDYQLATESNYLYYLDTLIVSTENNQPFPTYPFPVVEGHYNYGTGFITLDLNGNIKEDHFVQVTYLDSIGNVLKTVNGNNDTTSVLITGSMMQYFNIDNQGNMYMSRNTNDICYVACDTCAEMFEEYSFANGRLGGIRFIIDGNQRTFDYMPNGNGEKLGANNAMLLKFSPHFNNLIWAKYMIKDTVGNGANPITMQPYITGMTGDNEGNIYACGYIDHSLSIVDTNYYRTLILDSNNLNQTIELKSFEQEVSFLIKYNSNGNVIYAKQLKSNIDYSANYNVPIMSVFNGLTLNENNTSIFVLGSAQKNYFNDTSSNHSQFVIDNNVLDLRNNVFFIRFNKDNGNYISYGKVNTPYTSSIRGILSNHDIVSHNNQLFTQFEYTGDLYLRDTVYHNTFGVFRLAMIRWDDEGHVIGGIDYNAVGNNNYSSSTTIDNNGNLYLTGTITSGASFGTNTLTNGAYIAKYTDSTFNTPYIYQSIGEIQNIGGISIYPNPTQNEINITTQQERIKSCTLTTLDGKEYNLRPIMNDSNGAKINIESMPIGTYILTVKTNKNIYHNKVVKIK
jgi:hypothetical protein